MEISTIKDFSQGISSIENAETKLKNDYNNHLKSLKKDTLSQFSVKVTFINDKPDTVVYNENGYINNKSDITHSNGTSGWDIAKEVGLSAIPVYGTIREFQKGNIGWGIFGAVTDVLTLIPVVGVGAKALGTAIRGGSAAVRAARIGLTAGEVASKATTMTVAKQFAVGASEGLAKSGKELGKATLRAADPGIELLYKSGKLVTSGTAKVVTAPTKAAIAVKTAVTANATKIISNFSKWKNLSSSAISSGSEAVNILQQGFYKIKSTDKLGEQFIVDFPRAKYKVNGKIIPRGDINALEKSVPDLRKRQLISAYAHQTVLADPAVNVMLSAPHVFTKYGAHSSKVSYEIKDLSNGEMKLIAKNESHLKPMDPLIKGEKKYSSYGIKTEMIISENKIPVPKYSYYIR